MPQFQLLASLNSPFVHKVLIVATELGVRDQLEVVNQAVNPTAANQQVSGANPLGKIPVLIVPDSSPIFDSSVIVQFLDSLGDADKHVLPPAGARRRYDTLTVEALGDGILDAAILVRYETHLRTAELRSTPWLDGQRAKIERGLTQLIGTARPPADSPAPLPLEGIVIATVLWYLGRRFPDLAWWEWPGGAALKEWYDEVKNRPGWAADDGPSI